MLCRGFKVNTSPRSRAGRPDAVMRFQRQELGALRRLADRELITGACSTPCSFLPQSRRIAAIWAPNFGPGRNSLTFFNSVRAYALDVLPATVSRTAANRILHGHQRFCPH